MTDLFETPFDVAWEVLKSTLPIRPKTMQWETDPKRTRRYEQTGGIARRGREKMMDDFPERFNDPMEEEDVMDDEQGIYDNYTNAAADSHPTRSPGTANDFGKYPFWIGDGRTDRAVMHPQGGEMSFDARGEPNKFSFDEMEPRTIESEFSRQMMRRILGE